MCTDPNPNFRKFLLKSLSENRHLKLQHSVVASGEDLSASHTGGQHGRGAVRLGAVLRDQHQEHPDGSFASAQTGKLGQREGDRDANLCLDKPSCVY